MKSRSFLDKALLLEEKRSTLLYYGFVYVVGLLYHVFYYYLMEMFLRDFQLDKFLILGLPFILLLPLFFVALMFLKSPFLYLIKYVFVGVFVLSTLVAELTSYSLSGLYDGGNIGEVFMVIFAAIFVNQNFFWFVAGSILFKYFIVVIVYPDLLLKILLPFGLSGIVCILGYVILRRFLAYVNSINTVYNEHFSSMVKGIIAMLELKDPHTKGHSERVAKYSVALARKVGKFSEQELNTLYYSCLIHDIGKMQVSDDILTKPDRLTENEYEVVKMHTIFGVNAIKGIESLQPCIDIVRNHHERWDGTGYPDGLKGEEIPLLTRIAAIADAFDAMTSHRAYRAALTPDEAYSRIIRGAGTQFDPGLIPYFKNVFPTWLSILHDYHDTHEEEYNRLYGA
jgi:putative nucleotidyltransferase with HDIG domain